MAKTAIISVDGHVRGSRRQYREYVPKKYLETYDDSVRAAEEAGTPDAGNLHPEFSPDVQWDSDLRMREPREHRRGRRGPIQQRSAFPGQSA